MLSCDRQHWGTVLHLGEGLPWRQVWPGVGNTRTGGQCVLPRTVITIQQISNNKQSLSLAGSVTGATTTVHTASGQSLFELHIQRVGLAQVCLLLPSLLLLLMCLLLPSLLLLVILQLLFLLLLLKDSSTPSPGSPPHPGPDLPKYICVLAFL